MTALSIFSKICKNLFLLADIFQLHNCQLLGFINVSTSRKREQGSGKLRVWEILIVIWKPFQFLTKFEKRPPCLHLEEISPTIFFKTLPAQN